MKNSIIVKLKVPLKVPLKVKVRTWSGHCQVTKIGFHHHHPHHSELCDTLHGQLLASKIDRIGRIRTVDLLIVAVHLLML